MDTYEMYCGMCGNEGNRLLAEYHVTVVYSDHKEEEFDLCWEHALRIITHCFHFPDKYLSIVLEVL